MSQGDRVGGRDALTVVAMRAPERPARQGLPAPEAPGKRAPRQDPPARVVEPEDVGQPASATGSAVVPARQGRQGQGRQEMQRQGQEREGQGRQGKERFGPLTPASARRRPARPDIDLDELWAPLKRYRAPEDREFLPGALEIIEAPASPIRVVLAYALCGLIAAALAWSWFGRLDVYASAPGKIQVSGRTKVVEPLAPGTVTQIRVNDGDAVKAGDVLVELDPAEAIANRTVVVNSLDIARAEIVRRQAAIAAVGRTPVETRPSVQWTGDLPAAVRDREEQALRSDLASLATTLANLSAQKKELEAQRDKYQASIAPQQANNELLKEQVGMSDQLFKNGWNSRLTLLGYLLQLQQGQIQITTLQGSLEAAKAAIPVVDSQIAQNLQTFVTTNTQALVSAQQQVDELVQSLAKADVKLGNMTLRASTSGTIHASAVTTVGQVVSTGQQIMQIVPGGTALEIEAYVLNTDAGFVKVGQEAIIKVDAFPYTRYGTISGKVVKLAADALPGKQAAQQQKNASTPPSSSGDMSITTAAEQTSDLVFPVIVVPDQTTVNVDGRPVPLTSGMTVSIQIQTESRRAIDYILSPIQSALFSAGQER